MLLLLQLIRKKMLVYKMSLVELKESDSQQYKFEVMSDNKLYAKELNSNHLLDLFYIVIWKSYLEEENISESALTI